VVTESKDLRTGRSIWQTHAPPSPPHRRLGRNVAADVLIVGAGITGAMIADALAAEGLKVVVADKRGLAKGATTASTALVQHEIDRPLIKLARTIGKTDAMRAWRRSRLAVDALTARLEELGVTDVVRRNSLYLAGNLLDKDELRREHEARRAAGLASLFLDGKMLRARFGIDRTAALLSYDGLVIDPRRTTLALLQAASANKARIFAPAEIVDIETKRSGITVTEKHGRNIHCRQVVFATGYELPLGVPHGAHRVASTWAIATPRQPRRLWPEQCTIWEASAPYLYLRTTSDGRILCGGEDEDFSNETARDALLPRKSKVLARKLGRLIGGADTRIDFAWTGSFGESATGLPTIARVPGRPNCWIALGYGGNGTTYAQIAADIIGGALTGRPDADADLYDFPRQSTAQPRPAEKAGRPT
jgi:glycine/D-amino acid oxidase-like deaminating enzyme